MTLDGLLVDNLSMVTLLELSSELGRQLAPAGGGPAASRRLSGVHVSELEDPTPYLEGGELLLSTGMSLNTDDAGSYVGRLQARGVHALGIGLGPHFAELPGGLKEACRRADVELLVVPDGVPFQNVSRAYWGLAARGGKAELMGSLGTQTALARAAMRADATAAVVRGLAQEINGWAAYLPAGSGAQTYWPVSIRPLLPQLRAETLRLNRTGVHSAATFEVDGGPVVEYPIADGDQILGFLAVGPGRTLTAADRQIILTVCTLLAIKARERQAAADVAATFGAAVTKLLLAGQAEAARLVAQDAGLPDLAPRLRLLALRRTNYDDVDSALRMAPGLPRSPGLPALPSDLASVALRHEEHDVVYLVLNEGELKKGAPKEAELTQAGPGWRDSPAVAAVLSEPVLLSELAATQQTLRRSLSRAPAGVLTGADEDDHARAQQWAQMLADYSGVDLQASVTSYLRHRGRWEEASRELGLHRNSVRHRIGIAESLLEVDLNNPDVAAPLWLALRSSTIHP